MHGGGSDRSWMVVVLRTRDFSISKIGKPLVAPKAKVESWLNDETACSTIFIVIR